MNDRPREGGQIAKSMTMSGNTLQNTTSVPPAVNQPKLHYATSSSRNMKSVDLSSDSDDEPEEDNEVDNRSARFDTTEEVITVSNSPYPKRNIASVNYDEGIWHNKTPENFPKRPKPTSTKSVSKLRGIIVGTWKGSEKSPDHNKQCDVYGFIDEMKRLQFRKYGSYGNRVKLDDITLNPYLSTKKHDEVKQYVIFNSENQEQPDGVSRESQGNGIEASAKVSENQSSSKPEILLGFWADSDQKNDKDKHAVFGTIVLNSNHRFRFMIRKSTRDGRVVLGNFPQGPGNYQVQYEKIVLEEHLSGLKRSEVEQYILIRQKEILEGGNCDSRSQQLNTVRLAKAAVASEHPQGANLSGQSISDPDPEPEKYQRQREISGGKIAERQQPPHIHGANEDSTDNTLADQSAPHRKSSAEQQLAKSMNKLNKTWEAQQAAKPQQPATSTHLEGTANGSSSTKDNVKIHDGITYTRRQNGMLKGIHLGAPRILNIDGEDYVEYRVLTKPSPF
ncbi:hypothetical protein BCIN_13g01670 [Botrytis cinerea B05.10]|uniref:Uncharacterized protein n=1 Tax=Botryotinia fuckeliana (strain B05.10) TaxID=332648 RepID=A0A384K0G2_BOTFB|nr:hypothetical protein BCIN_13g01670 [Botrytis cinerea B05.10]ATZ56326.1 hypothetical protein BCIN_13g01670 [Botrytis cinerea B05.10]